MVGLIDQNKFGIKAQAAVEFLTTYAWAIIIIAGMLALLVYFLTLPNTVNPPQCFFQSSINCKALIVGSNSVATKVAMLLVNSQSFAVLNPKVLVDMGSYGSGTNISCTPAYVLPGGAILCSVVLPIQIPQGAAVGGTIYLNVTACPSGNINNCQPQQLQNFKGNFTTHIVPFIPVITTTSTITSVTTSV